MSERGKVEIEYDRVDIDADKVHSIESIQTHINDFISKGATHIRFYPQSGYDEVELYPLSYRDETDEEMEARIAKRKAWELQQLEYKRQEYVRLKKIFEE